MESFKADENTMVYMDYTQTITMWDSLENPAQKLNVKLWMSKNYLKYITPDIQVFQNEKDAVMIVNSRKLIIRSSAEDLENDDSQLRKKELFTKLKDTLYKSLVAVKCDTYEDTKGVKHTKIFFSSPEFIQEKFKITEMIYQLDATNNKMERTTTFFSKKSDMKRSAVVYNEISKSKKNTGNENFINNIFTRKDKLKSKYVGYQLIDNR